jgi:hypothetical protein
MKLNTNLFYVPNFQRNTLLKICANCEARNLLIAVTEILLISRTVSRVFLDAEVLDTGCKANAYWRF